MKPQNTTEDTCNFFTCNKTFFYSFLKALFLSNTNIYVTSSQNTTNFIALFLYNMLITTTCFSHFLGHHQVVLYNTLKAKQIQPDDGLEKGQNM